MTKYVEYFDEDEYFDVKYFDPVTKRTYFVGQGIREGELDAPWFTLYSTDGKNGTHRLKSPALPLRDTKEEAQRDLDAYARKKGWEARYDDDELAPDETNSLDEQPKPYYEPPADAIRQPSGWVEVSKLRHEYIILNEPMLGCMDCPAKRLGIGDKGEIIGAICLDPTGADERSGCHEPKDKPVQEDPGPEQDEKCIGLSVCGGPCDETCPVIRKQNQTENTENAGKTAGPSYSLVPIQLLKPNPANPRNRFDQEALDKLTESIKQVGILEPILCVKNVLDEWGSFELRIVAGERRHRAALAAGLQEVPVIIRDLTPDQEFEVMLTENIQRQDLDPIEEAQAFQAALARGWKQTELAEKLGISQAQVANRLRLLKLPPEVQEDISREIISPGHGLALVKVAAVPELVKAIAKEFQDYGVPVARAADIVDREIRSRGKPLYSSNWDAPKFDHQTICIASKCKYRIHAITPSYESGRNYEREHPYCLKPECWERHQKEAIDAEREAKMAEIRAKAQAAGQETEQVELPKLKDLDYNSYEKFTNYSDIKIDECTGCEKIVDALGHENEVVQICTDRACWEKKAQAKIREKAKATKEKKSTFEDIKDRILEMAKLQKEPDRRLLTYMAVMALCEPIRSSSWTHEKVWKVAYKFFGWPGEEYPGWHHEAGIKDLLNNLEKMGQGELWQVVLFGLLRGIDPDEKVFHLTLSSMTEETNIEQ